MKFLRHFNKFFKLRVGDVRCHMLRKREKWGIKYLVLLRARRKWHDWQSTQNEWFERCQTASGRRHIHEFNFIIVQYTCLYRVHYTRTVVRVSCISYVSLRCLYWYTIYTYRCTLYFLRTYEYCVHVSLRVHVLVSLLI